MIEIDISSDFQKQNQDDSTDRDNRIIIIGNLGVSNSCVSTGDDEAEKSSTEMNIGKTKQSNGSGKPRSQVWQNFVGVGHSKSKVYQKATCIHCSQSISPQPARMEKHLQKCLNYKHIAPGKKMKTLLKTPSIKK